MWVFSWSGPVLSSPTPVFPHGCPQSSMGYFISSVEPFVTNTGMDALSHPIFHSLIHTFTKI
jgi:hypothetical protein